MIEIAGKLFRLSSIDHVEAMGQNFSTGRMQSRICLRSGEWIYVDESYDEVKALVIKAEQDALAASMCAHGTIGVCMYCIMPTLDAIESTFRSRS